MIPTKLNSIGDENVKERSQSLLHQVNDSYVWLGERRHHFQNLRRNPFYIRSMIPTLAKLLPMQRSDFVAIPSTSGQWFLLEIPTSIDTTVNRRNPFYIRSMIPTYRIIALNDFGDMSQSLLHQVNDSYYIRTHRKNNAWQSRNPFYIRSMIPTRENRNDGISPTEGRNPFYIRSMIPT